MKLRIKNPCKRFHHSKIQTYNIVGMEKQGTDDIDAEVLTMQTNLQK